ncbi:hypothetical protein JRQ81_001552 [Phrynocephalus forsythii]|uniref:Mos1 transposase HTH domain-containing protein n=1 Tax=Phrynocephalus forsythii TaxID=171643 RepID=A0A9Q1B8K3_9SAUR|nr:hypothetical protein JRQ81_001552 [Phrynocephalus forsythii]
MMNKIEARSVIKFLHLKGNKARQIHYEMKAVYGDERPSYDTVVRWKRNFQNGHMSLTGKPRAGRSSVHWMTFSNTGRLQSGKSQASSVGLSSSTCLVNGWTTTGTGEHGSSSRDVFEI